MLGCIILGWAFIVYLIYRNFRIGGKFSRGLLDTLQFNCGMDDSSDPAYDFGCILGMLILIGGFVLLCVSTVLYLD